MREREKEKITEKISATTATISHIQLNEQNNIKRCLLYYINLYALT